VNPHVLIISTKVDVSTDAVVEALEAKNVGYTRVDTEEFPFSDSLTFAIATGMRQPQITFRHMEKYVQNVEDVSSVWYRRVRAPERPQNMSIGVYDFCMREARSALNGVVLALEGRAMSPPSSVWSAEHKPFQLHMASKIGLNIPETVITNDPNEVQEAFRRYHGKMIAKPVRTGFVDYGSEQHAIYTSQVLEEHLDHLSSTKWSPAIYQPLIEKECDIRVTVVGDNVFTAEIDSQSDPTALVDWRKTQNPLLPHRKCELNSTVQEKLLRLLSALNLKFGAIDLIRTKSGELIFLEVNPNGQWLWLDDQLEFGITEAIAKWLI
jgi:glutathione synthase/RimK-type ligase-like ATP-grasp enzyme